LFKEADHNSRPEMTSFTISALNFVVVSSLLEASWTTPVPGPTPCTSCENGNAIAFGDDDPHITVRLGRSQLDRPICYDLDGSSGDAFRLFRVGNLMTVDGHLMQSPRYKHHNSSYFGKMIFNTKDVKITVTHDLVTVTSGAAKPKFHKWRKSVPKHHSTLFADPSVDLSVVHFRRKVMKISFQGTDFEIKKNLLKYGKSKKDFFYLGIYLSPNEGTTYGGIIGEMLEKKGVYRKDGDRHFLEVNGVSIRVTEKKQKDELNHKSVKCWLVSDVKSLLSRPFSEYRL